ncbi:winged helix-turn-helix domain-containing protein [Azohydromonas caseinilytica]|uniref:OmpR/PhoB-type domain-containing protein n=1 Tax=Azohydromonas caseinilytica TaxID=2728836 RepID=A0A848FED1_9BURK|nr:winged helix-turn-helix domain-containing protein [Azohydromonas caseinilytica]NML17175.1 hypothetical protein [Azohydromonas caseinilytica]
MDLPTPLLRLAGGSFDPLRGELRLGGHCARLRPRSAAVLAMLLEERGRVVGREELMRRVWPDVVVTDDSLAQCIKEIRRALGPAADRIRTLPRLGYAYAETVPAEAAGTAAEPAPAEPVPVAAPDPAEVPSVAATAGPTDAPAAAPAPVPEAAAEGAAARLGWARAAPLRWLLGGVALTLALAALVLLAPGLWAPAREAPPLSIAVLPLAGAGGDRVGADLSDAIADNLTTDLTRIPGAFVVARGAADAYRGRAVDARRVGRELGVRYLVEGSLHQAGGPTRLNLRLVDTRAGEVLWSARYEGVEADLATLPRAVSAQVARELQLVLLESEAVRAGHHPASRPEEALELARAHLRANPAHAPAWLWAAQAHLRLGDYAAAAAEAEQAIRLAPPDVADAALLYSVLSRARLLGGDARGALAAAERAAAAPGANRYVPLLIAAAAMQGGDPARARRVMEEFVQRNPGISAELLRARRQELGGNLAGEERYIAALVAAGLPPK